MLHGNFMPRAHDTAREERERRSKSICCDAQPALVSHVLIGIERRNEHETPVEKVVNRREGVAFAQVVENVEKINFQKCPNRYMQHDIMVL